MKRLFQRYCHASRFSDDKETTFANNLNILQLFDRLKPLHKIIMLLNICRYSVHAWGVRNRVTFAGSKKHLLVIHPQENHGDPSKLLACTMDVDFRMHTCIDQLLARIRPRSAAVPGTRYLYSRSEFIVQYKIHIWSLVEMHCETYFHGATILLDQVGQSQRSFLHNLNVSESQTFLDRKFALCSLGRHIAILGLLHKRVLGQCHSSFNRLLRWFDATLSSGGAPATTSNFTVTGLKLLNNEDCMVSRFSPWWPSTTIFRYP